jgi:hypothetical protein
MTQAVTNTASSPAGVDNGAVRAADALLRAAGGRTVLLRMAAPAVPGDVGEQLGLATPQFQDVPLGPAVFRKARPTGAAGAAPRWELLISASAVAKVAGPQGFQPAEAIFAAAVGALVDDLLLEVLEVTAAQAFGAAYVYRLLVRERAADGL